MTHFAEDMTLKEARDLLRALIADGHHCPVCRQFAKIYRRKVNATMARTLIKVYRAGTDFVHGPSLPGDTHEISQLSWWGLIEEERVRRPDGGRAGWWRITSDGVRWVCARATVPKYAKIYDGRCLGLEGSQVTIQQALGKRFNYYELMRGV